MSLVPPTFFPENGLPSMSKSAQDLRCVFDKGGIVPFRYCFTWVVFFCIVLIFGIFQNRAGPSNALSEVDEEEEDIEDV